MRLAYYLSFSLNGVVVRIFKHSSIFMKNNKINNECPLYTFPISGSRGGSLGKPYFSTKCTQWHHVVPTQNSGLFFGLLSGIILCMQILPPKIYPIVDLVALAIFNLSCPINLVPTRYSLLSTRLGPILEFVTPPHQFSTLLSLKNSISHRRFL
jgi:hypothetical protein